MIATSATSKLMKKKPWHLGAELIFLKKISRSTYEIWQ
jgi:hypothetical protein